jgi:hypothetical protein
MMRATICAAVDEAAEVEAAERWLEQHRASLSYISEQFGCGCCVLMWNVEGADAVVSTLPESLSAMSEWSRGEGSSG